MIKIIIIWRYIIIIKSCIISELQVVTWKWITYNIINIAKHLNWLNYNFFLNYNYDFGLRSNKYSPKGLWDDIASDNQNFPRLVTGGIPTSPPLKNKQELLQNKRKITLEKTDEDGEIFYDASAFLAKGDNRGANWKYPEVSKGSLG